MKKKKDKFSIGDRIVTKKEFYFNGENLGDRLGTVINTFSYVLVHLENYDYNPIKCFRNEVMLLEDRYSREEEDNEQLDFDWTGHL